MTSIIQYTSDDFLQTHFISRPMNTVEPGRPGRKAASWQTGLLQSQQAWERVTETF